LGGFFAGATFMDHDQRFKNLIKVFFREFLLLFFKEWAARLEVEAVEWLDKEVFPEPPEGTRHILDLVGKLPTKETTPGQRPGESDQWLALVHIEIESPDKATPLRPRMFDAYVLLKHLACSIYCWWLSWQLNGSQAAADGEAMQ
jgi:hypothetical protein